MVMFFKLWIYDGGSPPKGLASFIKFHTRILILPVYGCHFQIHPPFCRFWLVLTTSEVRAQHHAVLAQSLQVFGENGVGSLLWAALGHCGLVVDNHGTYPNRLEYPMVYSTMVVPPSSKKLDKGSVITRVCLPTKKQVMVWYVSPWWVSPLFSPSSRSNLPDMKLRWNELCRTSLVLTVAFLPSKMVQNPQKPYLPQRDIDTAWAILGTPKSMDTCLEKGRCFLKAKLKRPVPLGCPRRIHGVKQRQRRRSLTNLTKDTVSV